MTIIDIALIFATVLALIAWFTERCRRQDEAWWIRYYRQQVEARDELVRRYVAENKALLSIAPTVDEVQRVLSYLEDD